MFSVGALGYGLLEIVWRGHTHWSMTVAGGICFSSLGVLSEKCKKTGLLLKGVFGGLLITTVEFLFGIVFNIILKKGVWDYSKLPFHILGQICPRYAGLWTLLSIGAVPFAGKLRQRIGNKKTDKRGTLNGLSAQNLGGN